MKVVPLSTTFPFYRTVRSLFRPGNMFCYDGLAVINAVMFTNIQLWSLALLSMLIGIGINILTERKAI